MTHIKPIGLTIRRSRKQFALLSMSSLVIVAGILTAILLPSPKANAVTPPDSCFAFTAGTNTITNYYDNQGNNGSNLACPKAVDIPSTIGGVAVIRIGNNAFQNKQLTSVSLPTGIQTIGTFAFYTNKLTSLTIPVGVTTIGAQAFWVNNITSLTLPNTLTTIGATAFANNLLTSVTIPSSVTSIGSRAFQSNQITDPVILGTPTGPNVFQMNPINSITYNGTMRAVPVGPITPIDACFSFTAGTGTITAYRLFDLTLLKAGTACMARNITIPSTIGGVAVTKIGDNSSSQQNLTGVTIPAGVTSIGMFAFSSNQLTSISVPISVTSIGSGAFSSNLLTSFSLPSSVTSLGSNVLNGNLLTDSSLVIPATFVGEVGIGNNKFTTLTLPNTLTQMSSYNYVYNSLPRLTIPAGVTTIDPDAMFGQNPWGNDPEFYNNLGSDDPAVAQGVYDTMWYLRAYTANSANPYGLTDSAISEEWDFGDGNKNGIDSDSIGGHIINPASTVIHYKDASGNTIAPDVTVTGLKTGKTPSSSLDSNDYLHSYLVTESAISAPLDPYDPTPEEQAAMETGFDQYYRMGDSVTFSPKNLADYVTPSAQTVTLNEEDNVVTFTYTPVITSVSFSNQIVVDGELESGTPPAGTSVSLITKSSLNITTGDCNSIESANLLAPSAITANNIPSNTTLLGGLDFSLTCSTSGQTGIEYTLGSRVLDTSKLRIFKYNSTTHVLTDITSQVSFVTKTVDGTSRTVISYSLTDGGNFDEDGQANGTIEDPLVIGYVSDTAELAETGMSLGWMLALPFTALLLGGSLLFTRLRKQLP